MNKGFYLLLVGVLVCSTVWGNSINFETLYTSLLYPASVGQGMTNTHPVGSEKDLSPPIFVDLVFSQGGNGCRTITRECTGESCQVIGRASGVTCHMPLVYLGEIIHNEDSVISYYDDFWLEITQLGVPGVMTIRVEPEYTSAGQGAWNYHLTLFYSHGMIQSPGGDIVNIFRPDSSFITQIFFDGANGRLRVNSLMTGYTLTVFENCNFTITNCDEPGDGTLDPDPHPGPGGEPDRGLRGYTNSVYERAGTASSKTRVSGPENNDWKVTNPISDEINIFFEHPLKSDSPLSVYRMDGQLLERTLLLAGQSNHRLPAVYLLPGIYLLRLDTDLGVETKMVVKH